MLCFLSSKCKIIQVENRRRRHYNIVYLYTCSSLRYSDVELKAADVHRCSLLSSSKKFHEVHGKANISEPF